MRAGDQDRRITINKREAAEDSFGADKEGFEKICDTWANVQYLQGKERLAAGEVAGTQNAIFTMRYRQDVAQAGININVVFQGRTFYIYDSTEIGRREGLQLTGKIRQQ